MARFRPFRGIRFNSANIGSLDAVVAPPYDVISPEGRDALLASGPYNVTRLILNPDGHRAAGEQFRAWLDQGVLVREDRPAFYLYRQDFEREGEHARVGVIGALHLEPFSRGVVLPHEQTFAKHKRDRLELTGEVKANLSPIFGLYSNPDFDPAPDDGWESPAEVDVVHEGMRNRLWILRDAANLAAVEAALEDRRVFIADGHHRYETALNYFRAIHDEAGPPVEADAPGDDRAPSAHVLAFLGRFEDPGMIILPTHRIASSLGGANVTAFERALQERFAIERVPSSLEGRRRALAWLEEAGLERNVFVVGLRGRGEYLLVERPVASASGRRADRLDVTVLHHEILGAALASCGGGEAELGYSADTAETFDRLDAGEAEAVFVLRATRAQQMAEVCSAGELLPQKSTYFFPKLLTGLVFHSLDSADTA